MSDRSHHVLLVSLYDSEITSEIPHLFHRAGFGVDVYCSKHSWLLKSRYKDRWYDSTSKDARTFVLDLAELTRDHRYSWVVFLDDAALRAGQDYLAEEDARRLLPLTDMRYKALAGSKIALSFFSAQKHIRTPLFSIHDGVSDIVTSAKGVPFPLLLKVDRSGGGRGITFCPDIPSLRSAYSALQPERKKGLLIQEYIQGENISVEALYRGGTLIAHARARVLKNVNGEFDGSCVRAYEHRAGLQEELERIGTSFGFDGFCSFTFMYRPEEDAHYLVEADLRPHSWFSLSRFAGVDFADAIRSRMSGVLYAPVPATKVLRYFSRDIIRNVRRHEMRELLYWLCNIDGRWAYIPAHDRTLFLATFTQIARTFLYDITWLRPVGRRILHAIRALKTPALSPRPLDAQVRRRVLGYVREEKRLISFGIIFALLQTISLLPVPFLIKYGLDSIISQQNTTSILVSFGSVIALLITSSLFMLMNRRVALTATKSILSGIRQTLVRYILSRDHAFYANEDIDALHTAIVQNTERFDRALSRLLSQTLPSLFIVTALLCVLFYLNTLLALVLVVCVPLAYAISRRIGRILQKSVRQFYSDFKDFSVGISFVLTLNELISISGSAYRETKRQDERIRALQASGMRMAWLSAVYNAAYGNVVMTAAALILLVGGVEVVRGTMTIGAVLSFYVALNFAATNARAVLSSIPSLIEGQESLRSLLPYLEAVAEPDKPLPYTLSYPIAFTGVSFGYGVKNILKNVSFEIAKGSTTGIFGDSGTGKTTLVRLLLGLYSPSAGTITVGTDDLRMLHAASFRRTVGVLPQDPLFFLGSIKENLTCGSEVASDKLEEICTLCRIHKTILALPEGYDTVIGNRGPSLSGGEKQRLALARALIQNPQLLILDEPDNNLSTKLIIDILSDIKDRGYTVVVISHDESLKTFVDSALLIGGGTVTRASPRTLLSSNDTLASLGRPILS